MFARKPQQNPQPPSSADDDPVRKSTPPPPTTTTSPNPAVPYADDGGNDNPISSNSSEASSSPEGRTSNKEATTSPEGPQKPALSSSKGSYLRDVWRQAVRYDEESFIYSLRIAVAMFVAALFTLVNPGDFVFPQTPWILASAAVVGWQNTLDTATAVKRAVERTFGTFLGAVLGLAIGFVSLPLQFTKPGQATFLGIATAAFCFIMPYVTANVGLRGSYAARLCLVSYAIISLSFYTSNEPCHPSGWYMGVWRAINIMLGCFIGAAALVIHPRSMKGMIVKRVKTQVKSVGESTCQVLETACASFTDHHHGALAHWDDLLTAGNDGGGTRGGSSADNDVTPFETDPAYVAYLKGAHGWKDCNELFSMLKYDHTLWSMTKDEKAEFQHYMTIVSHRVFRMHTNLVVLATIIRGASASIAREMRRSSLIGKEDPSGTAPPSIDAAFESLRDIGQRIKVLLDSNQRPDDRNGALKTLVGRDLLIVGHMVSQEQEESVKRRHELMAASKDGMDKTLEQLQGMLLSRFDSTWRGRSPLEHIESHQQVSLFFLLVEHLIIRATCLYQLLRPELYDK